MPDGTDRQTRFSVNYEGLLALLKQSGGLSPNPIAPKFSTEQRAMALLRLLREQDVRAIETGPLSRINPARWVGADAFFNPFTKTIHAGEVQNLFSLSSDPLSPRLSGATGRALQEAAHAKQLQNMGLLKFLFAGAKSIPSQLRGTAYSGTEGLEFEAHEQIAPVLVKRFYDLLREGN